MITTYTDNLTPSLDERIGQAVEPYRRQITQLGTVPGVSTANAPAILAEIGPDMSRFATPGQLASWAKFTPGVNQSAGKTKGTNATGTGNRYLARALGQSAVATRRTKTFLGDRYRRLSRRIGKKKAQVAVGHSMLIGIWHMFNDPDAVWIDLGPDHHTHTRTTTERTVTTHLQALHNLGYKVTLTPAGS